MHMRQTLTFSLLICSDDCKLKRERERELVTPLRLTFKLAVFVAFTRITQKYKSIRFGMSFSTHTLREVVNENDESKTNSF